MGLPGRMNAQRSPGHRTKADFPGQRIRAAPQGRRYQTGIEFQPNVKGGIFMKKFTVAIVLALVLAFSSSVAYAASPVQSSNPATVSVTRGTPHSNAESRAVTGDVIFEQTFQVNAHTTTVRVGFVTLQFPKGSLPQDATSIELTARVFTSNGMAVLEVLPDTEGFQVPVRITASAYQGWLFDENLETNVRVKFRPTTFTVNHFSRYCWQ